MTYALGSLWLGEAGGSGTFSMSGGELDVTNANANAFVVGNAASSVATFTMNNGTLNMKRNASTFFQDFLQIGYGVNAVGTFTLNNGTVTCLGGIEIGSGGQGTLNVTGGTFMNNGWFGLGRGGNGNNANCSAYFNLSGGIVYLGRNNGTDTGLNGMSFNQGGTNATFTMSGGTLYTPAFKFGNVAQTDWEIMTVSAGDVYLGGWGVVSNSAAGTHTVSINLSGGTFHSVNLLPNPSGILIGSGDVGSGGTNWSWAATLPINLTNNPGSGTVIFAPELTRTFTLGSPISGPGALVVNGPGTVALGAANTYTGGTTISQGSLQFNTGASVVDATLSVPSGSAIIFNSANTVQNITNNVTGGGDVLVTGSAYMYGTLSHSGKTIVTAGTLALANALNNTSSVTVSNTGTLAGVGPIGAPVTVTSTTTQGAHLRMGMSPLNIPGTLTINNSLTLGVGSELDIKLGTATTTGGGVNDLLAVNGNLTINSNAFVNIVPLQQLTPGSYTIITYTGTRSGYFTNTITSLSRYTFALDYSTANQIKLTVSGTPPSLVWQGATNTTWDVLGTSNWVNGVSGTGPIAIFEEGDAVTFDAAATNFNVAIATTLYPASITFNNNSNYSVTATGTGRITGGTGITKNGNGTLVMASGNGVGNDFTGPVQINGGIFRMSGVNSLGATNGGTTVANGATLDINGGYPVAGGEPLVLQGLGFGGTNGALMNSGASLSGPGLGNVTLNNDTLINTPGRLDFGNNNVPGGSFQGNGHTLTKIGSGQLYFYDFGQTHVGDINVLAGQLGFQGPNIDMGNTANTCTVVGPSGSIRFFAASGLLLNKNLVLTNGTTLDVNSGSNNFGGPITLWQTNTISVNAGNYQLVLNGAISGSGGFNKAGNGPLYLNGANNYTGPTLINAGNIVLGAGASIANSSLINLAGGTVLDATVPGLALGSGVTLSGSGSLAGNISVGSASVISPGTATAAGTLSFSNDLAITSVTNIIKLSGDPYTVGSGVNDLLLIGGNLTLNGVSTIKVVPTGSLSPNANYTIAQYAAAGSGTLTGGASNLRVVTDNPRYTLTVVDPTQTSPYIQVGASGNPAALVWRGGNAPSPTAWDHSTTNWFNPGTSAFDLFYNTDQATFDDTAATNLVNIIGTNSASGIIMNNGTTQFKFVGGGLLGGPLQMNGAGSLTLAMSNPPAFTSITANSGTLVFNVQGVTNYANNAAISDNGSYEGVIVQAGTNTLLLSGNNQTMTATLLVTNGVLRYTNANNLGVPAAPLYATNNGTLDMNAVYPGIKNIIIAGAGFNGQGALISATGNSAANGPVNVALAGDATIGAPGTVRWDFCNAAASSPQIQGNDYKLTKVGTGTTIIYDQYDGDTHLGDIDITAGRLGFQIVNGGTVLLGDSSKTLTVRPNATLTFYDITNGVMNKNLVMNGGNGTIGGTYNGTLTNVACFDSAGVATTTNSFAGPITLVGSNNLFGMRRPLSLTGNISGSGGFVVGVSPVGAGTLPLYLSGINSYTGPTIISNSCQIVVGAGSSLGNSSLIQVNTGANLDVSALASLALGAGQTIIGAGTNIGNLVVGSGAILAPSFPGVAGTLTVKGNLTLQSGGTNVFKLNPNTGASDAVAGISSVTYGGNLILSNLTGAAYTAGTTFHLFSASIYNASAFTQIIPAKPGSWLLWDTSRLAVDGTLKVIAEPPPQFDTIGVLPDGNFQFTFSASVSSNYTVWASTNVGLPMSQWTVLRSGTVTTSPLVIDDLHATNYAQRFYRISVP